MSLSRKLFFFTAVCLVAASARAGHDFTFPEEREVRSMARATVDADGRFRAGTHEAVHRLHGIATGLPVYISDRAARACGNEADLARELKSSFLGEKGAAKVLAKIFDPENSQLVDPFAVILDDLGEARARSRSFYLRDYPQHGEARLVLDCSTDARAEWSPLLAHELTHALLNLGFRGEAWFEEMVAQIAEAAAGGTRPEQNLSVLASLPVWPALDDRKPGEAVVSDAVYAHSYLFGKYLFKNFGGFEIFRALVASKRADYGYCLQYEAPFACSINTLTLDGFFGAYDRLGFWPNSVTDAQLRREFTFAAVMNWLEVPSFSISPRWRAIVPLRERPASLQAGEFLVWDKALGLPADSRLVVVEVQKGAAKFYVRTVRPQTTRAEDLPDGPGSYVIFNDTKEEIRLD